MRVKIGDVDWQERWAALASAAESRAAHEAPRSADRWRDRAARFDRNSRAHVPGADSIEGLAGLVRAGDVVLDVGAGTGRHAVPLARSCARVVALEPSPAMRERLVARVEEEGARNVEVVEGAWPLAPAPIVDVAFSAHVVYGVPDLAPFVEAMTSCARRACALLLKVRAPSDALNDVYQAVHGVARARRPAALEAFAVLHQLGLAASFTMIDDTDRPLAFRDDEEDLREVAFRVGVVPDRDGLARVRAALDATCAREGDGWRVGSAGPSALVTWPGRAPAA